MAPKIQRNSSRTETGKLALAKIYRGPDPDITAPFFYGIFYADGQPKAAALAAMLCNTIAGFFIHSNVTSQTQFYRLQVLEP